MDDPTRRRLAAVGLGVVGSAAALGGLLYLIRRQIAEGDVVRVTLVHEIDPATRRLAERWLPPVQKMAEDGLTHRLRLFQRGQREDSEFGARPDLLVALVSPLSLSPSRKLY